MSAQSQSSPAPDTLPWTINGPTGCVNQTAIGGGEGGRVPVCVVYGTGPEHEAECSYLIESANNYALLRERNKALAEALRPFAQFACSPAGQCNCHNCAARAALDQQE